MQILESKRYRMATKFALEKLFVKMSDGKEFIFWFDGNGKITVGNGSFGQPAANAFSLVQVQDCPFATQTCKSACYVHLLEKAEQEVHAAYQHNSRDIRKVLEKSLYRKTTELAFADWIRGNCPAGFRWHVSGDIFSLRYSRFIRAVCDSAPEVFFWIYTRSFRYLEPLVGAENLVVNLSADRDNWQQALQTCHRFGFRLCYLTVEGEVPPDLPLDSVIFPSHELRGRYLSNPRQAPWWQSLTPRERRMVCPPDFFGQSESLRCGRCKKCF